MKIIATVIEVNVGVAIAKRGWHVDADAPFVALWEAPNGVHVWSAHSSSKQGALDSLRSSVRQYMADHCWLTVEDEEIAL